jgi:hypothetical protein
MRIQAAPSSARSGGKDPLSQAKIRAAAIAATRDMPAETPLTLDEIGLLTGHSVGALRQQKYAGRLPIRLRRIGRSLHGSLGDVREVYLGIPRQGV